MAAAKKNWKKIVIGSLILLVSLVMLLFIIRRDSRDETQNTVARQNTEGGKHIREEKGITLAVDIPIPEIDDEYVDATLKVPVHDWQEERSKNIGTETIEQTIENLANFDDMLLAMSSIPSRCTPTSAAFQKLVVVRLARVRKLLEKGRANPERVISPLRRSFQEALTGWPEAAADRRRIFQVAEKAGKGSLSFTEPDQFDKYRARSLAATYLLAEIGDYQSLPLMLKCYKMQEDYLKSPPVLFGHAPVPAALTLYAMHRLVSSFPEEKLNTQARQVRKDYLQLARCLPPPEKITVTKSWSANYDESDPRIAVFDPKGKVLQGEATMEMAVYPCTFTDSTIISDVEGKVSERTELLFKELGRFVEAAYPGAKFP